jgi:hypothetical protein
LAWGLLILIGVVMLLFGGKAKKSGGLETPTAA